MSVLLGGGPSIPVRYGGKYEDWFLIVEISSVLLGGGRSIQLRYGGIRKLYFTPSGAHLSTEKHKKVGETPCNQRNKGI